MNQRRKLATFAMAALFTALLSSCSQQEEAKVEKAVEKAAVDVKAKAEADAKAVEALALATEAYVYAYPLATMEMTRRIMTNVVGPEGTRAPMGQFVRLRD